jgi:hypothetical protein
MATMYDTPVGVGGKINTSTGQILSGSLSGQTAINSDALKQSPSIVVPPPPIYTDPTHIIAGGNATMAANTPAITPAPTTDTNTKTEADPYQGLKDMIASIGAPPSNAATYNSAYANSGVAEAQTAVNQKNQALTDAQGNLNSITAQIQGLNAQGQSAVLQSEGQGGLLSQYQGRANEIARQTAIKAIPLQVQALAAQAQVASAQGNATLAQGILTQAKTHLDTLYQIQSADAKAQYDYKASVVKSVYDFATKQEQSKLDAIQHQNDQAFQLKLEDIRFQHQQEAQKLQFVPATANQGAGTFNSQTGQFTPLEGANTPKGGGPLQLAQTKAKIDQLSALTSEGGLGSSVGTSFLTRAPQGFLGTVGALASVVGIPSVIGSTWNKLTGAQQNFISDTEQLRSQLNLDALIGAKAQGATFGALSDQELQVLSSSATKLGTWAMKDSNGQVTGYNTNETNFKNEIDKINNFAKLDYIIKGGAPADIGAKILPDGTVWVLNSAGTYTQLK